MTVAGVALRATLLQPPSLPPSLLLFALHFLLWANKGT